MSLTEDLDDYATDGLNDAILLSEEEGRSLPSNDTFKEKHNWWKHCQTYTLDTKPYPMCHERYQWNSYIAKQSKRRLEVEHDLDEDSCTTIDLKQARKRKKMAELRTLITIPEDNEEEDEQDEDEEMQQTEEQAQAARLESVRLYELSHPFEPLLTCKNDYNPGIERKEKEAKNVLYHLPDPDRARLWMSDWVQPNPTAPAANSVEPQGLHEEASSQEGGTRVRRMADSPEPLEPDSERPPPYTPEPPAVPYTSRWRQASSVHSEEEENEMRQQEQEQEFDVFGMSDEEGAQRRQSMLAVRR